MQITSNKDWERFEKLFFNLLIFNSGEFKSGVLMVNSTKAQGFEVNLRFLLLLTAIISLTIASLYVLIANSLKNRI